MRTAITGSSGTLLGREVQTSSSGAKEPAVPRLDHWGTDAAHVVELTDPLLEREQVDARNLHRLLEGAADRRRHHHLASAGRADGDGHGQVCQDP